MGKLFIIVQYLLPRHLLSRLTGLLAETRIVWLKNVLIGHFARHFDVNMAEAATTNPLAYENFNTFFTRALKDDARPIATDDHSIVCPADGAISQLGRIEAGRIFQAKGQYFTTRELLGGDTQRASQYKNGEFSTLYLSPRDYHRVHMPLDGTLIAQTYIPGDLFSVNQTAAENVPRLFARNERLVCYFDTPAGEMALVMVGAMIVAGIDTVWSGQIAPPAREPKTVDFQKAPAGVSLSKGDEMGRFKLGSTVILLFPENSISWSDSYQAGTATVLGQVLGNRLPA